MVSAYSALVFGVIGIDKRNLISAEGLGFRDIRHTFVGTLPAILARLSLSGELCLRQAVILPREAGETEERDDVAGAIGKHQQPMRTLPGD